MSRQKVVFVIVLAAVCLFIASIVASMFPHKQTLPNGYEVLVGDKGEAWVRSADRQVLVTEVTSVWASKDGILLERRSLDDKPPFGLKDCDYQWAKGRDALRPVSKLEAVTLSAAMERQTNSAKSCVK